MLAGLGLAEAVLVLCLYPAGALFFSLDALPPSVFSFSPCFCCYCDKHGETWGGGGGVEEIVIAHVMAYGIDGAWDGFAAYSVEEKSSYLR